MTDEADPLITIPAAARAIGLDRTTLGKQVRAGVVRSHDGKVRLSEVLADRAANIDLARSKRREGEIDTPERAAPSAPSQARAEPVEPEAHEADEEDGVPRVPPQGADIDGSHESGRPRGATGRPDLAHLGDTGRERGIVATGGLNDPDRARKRRSSWLGSAGGKSFW